MLKKIVFGVAIVVLLAQAADAIAQQASGGSSGRAMQVQRQGARGGGRSTGPGGMRGGLQAWLDELEEAHKNNDRQKTGELIAQMKQRMQGMQAGAARQPRGGPSQGAAAPGRGFRPGQPGGPQRPMAQTVTGSSFMDSRPGAKTDTEKKILAILDDMDRNQRRGMMNVPAQDGRLLRLLTEAVGAKHVVEVGTSNGYSGIWFCLALQKTGGKLTTHEIDAHRASLARENFKRAGVDKLITLVEGDAHEEVKKIKEPIDLLFLDADKDGYIDYFNKLLPVVRPGGLIVGHNMTQRMADPKYVRAITTNPDLETLLLHPQSGVSVTLKKR